MIDPLLEPIPDLPRISIKLPEKGVSFPNPFDHRDKMVYAHFYLTGDGRPARWRHYFVIEGDPRPDGGMYYRAVRLDLAVGWIVEGADILDIDPGPPGRMKRDRRFTPRPWADVQAWADAITRGDLVWEPPSEEEQGG